MARCPWTRLARCGYHERPQALRMRRSSSAANPCGCVPTSDPGPAPNYCVAKVEAVMSLRVCDRSLGDII